jgi:hypothetical protein
VVALSYVGFRMTPAGAPPTEEGLGRTALEFLPILAVLAIAQYPYNRVDATGQFVLDPVVPFDTAFHVGVSRELTLGYPPQVPGLAGFPLSYHLGLDLIRAA